MKFEFYSTKPESSLDKLTQIERVEMFSERMRNVMDFFAIIGSVESLGGKCPQQPMLQIYKIINWPNLKKWKNTKLISHGKECLEKKPRNTEEVWHWSF